MFVGDIVQESARMRLRKPVRMMGGMTAGMEGALGLVSLLVLATWYVHTENSTLEPLFTMHGVAIGFLEYARRTFHKAAQYERDAGGMNG